jgi:hypothetical protein
MNTLRRRIDPTCESGLGPLRILAVMHERGSDRKSIATGGTEPVANQRGQRRLLRNVHRKKNRDEGNSSRPHHHARRGPSHPGCHYSRTAIAFNGKLHRWCRPNHGECPPPPTGLLPAFPPRAEIAKNWSATPAGWRALTLDFKLPERTRNGTATDDPTSVTSHR